MQEFELGMPRVHQSLTSHALRACTRALPQLARHGAGVATCTCTALIMIAALQWDCANSPAVSAICSVHRHHVYGFGEGAT